MSHGVSPTRGAGAPTWLPVPRTGPAYLIGIVGLIMTVPIIYGSVRALVMYLSAEPSPFSGLLQLVSSRPLGFVSEHLVSSVVVLLITMTAEGCTVYRLPR